MKEYNNRDIAKKYAEYITGESLRRYVADKVKKYIGENPIVFDGAIGSGQLEQFVDASYIYGVDIQENSCESFKENIKNGVFKGGEVFNGSFFKYQNNVVADCVIMNPPFSLEFKHLPDDEKKLIQEEFPWKKSGKLDDIFILKSLKYTERYAFHICFPGVTYRKTEQKMRELIGTKLLELNLIENAFKDTNISVAFLVIDKLKESEEVKKEIYNCKSNSLILEEVVTEDVWRLPVEEREAEEINIQEVNKSLDDIILKNLDHHLETRMFIMQVFNEDLDFWNYLNKYYRILDKHKKRWLEIGG